MFQEGKRQIIGKAFGFFVAGYKFRNQSTDTQFAVRGAKLDLNFGSDAAMIATIFSSRSLVARAGEEQQQPIFLTENAQPGYKYLIAVRVNAEQADTALFRSDLTIEPPASRPDPSLIREGVLSAIPLIAAYSDGKDEREQQLATAVRAINFSPLQKGDQDGLCLSDLRLSASGQEQTQR